MLSPLLHLNNVCEWLWAYQKIKLVLPHRVSATGDDRAIHFIWQCLQMHAEGTLQLCSMQYVLLQAHFGRRSLLALCVYQHATTWPSPGMRNYIPVQRYNKQNPADHQKISGGRMLWEYLEIIFLLLSTSSSTKFESQPPSLGPTRTVFKAN